MIELARTFAKQLDNNEFSLAKEMMAEGCIYKFREQIITGAEKIIECYQGSFDAVADQLDEILFESKVEQLEPQLFKLLFTDKISKNGNSFEHRCEQTIRIAGDKVIEIQHFDLPGETDKLNAFFKENGIIRKPIANLTFRKARLKSESFKPG